MIVQIVRVVSFNPICFAFAFYYRGFRANKMQISCILIGPEDKSSSGQLSEMKLPFYLLMHGPQNTMGFTARLLEHADNKSLVDYAHGSYWKTESSHRHIREAYTPAGRGLKLKYKLE